MVGVDPRSGGTVGDGISLFRYAWYDIQVRSRGVLLRPTRELHST